MVKAPMEKGYYEFKLDDILEERDISINKLMRDTNTDFKVIKRLMNGENAKLDVIVLARFCEYFNCDITDIVEYHRQKETVNNN